MLSMAAVRLAAIDAHKVPAGQTAVSQAAAHAGRFVMAPPQPTAKPFAADGPGFPVLIDRDIGEGGAAGRLK